jgi:linoleate 8R-lipoxygenase/9,12-octadecadienoate 8-hydroperoxide 8R-isomerase
MASLNEFRQFAGLTPHKTFEDINPDAAVVEKLKNLYDSPDFVELYPGLVAEKAKPPKSPGSGLCVNFTTSYSILSDAVGLVRGDRFYTVDYTPKNLTNWGYVFLLISKFGHTDRISDTTKSNTIPALMTVLFSINSF